MAAGNDTPAQGTPATNPCGFFGGGTSAPAPSGGGDGAQQAAPAPQGSMMGAFFPLIIFILIFYFFILRPQRKRQKQHDNLISSIGRGDQIVTIGGFLGTVREVRDDTFQIELAEGVRVRILKSAVQTKRTAQPAQGTAEDKKD